MKEKDVAITDFILCIESFLFVIFLIKNNVSYSYKKSFLILFIGFSISSLIGGIFHGFFNDPSNPWQATFWQATLICIGICSYGFALSGIHLIYDFKQIQKYNYFLISVLIGYITITFYYHDFLIAIIIYLAAAILTLSGFIITYLKSKNNQIAMGIAGLLISLIAPIIQQLEVSLPIFHLTHNAVYHIVIMIALYLFYQGVVGVLNNKKGELT